MSTDAAINGLVMQQLNDKKNKKANFGIKPDNELFYSIVESISDGFFVLDYNWRFIYMNKEAENYFFVNRDEVIGKCIWNVFPQAVDTILYELIHRVKHSQEKMQFEAPSFFALDKWQAYSIYPSKAVISVFIKDITSRREKQRLSDEFFIRVFNAGLSMMTIKTLGGKIIDVNRSWLANTGYTRQEVVGKPEHAVRIWADEGTQEMINKRLSAGPIYNLEVNFRTKDGKVRTGLLSIEEIEVGSVKYFLEAITDITEQKEMEKEMAKLDRLNLIGQMAAGISHEFRNPITTVRGFIQMLSGRSDLAHIKDYFDIMIEEIDRANSIICEFLTLSKNKSLNLKRDNINICINKLFPMIQAGAFNDNKDVQLELSEIPDIYMDESEIRQLILNLVRNAIEASPPDGKVIIQTFRDGEEVVLAVKDEGSGIQPEALKKIGTPFFTTKENGTGLGLVICYRIAERHNAKIKIDTGPNGTTFFVRFKILSE